MSTSSAQPTPEQSASLEQPMSPRNEEKAHALGLTSATGLVIGSIVGHRRVHHAGGAWPAPAPWASSSWASSPSGAMLLAMLFGQLTKRVPNSDGGLYAYSRHEFGDFAGYLVGWCYWIQSWAGNAAIVSSWVFYVDALFGWTHRQRHGELGHRHGRAVGAGDHQPGRASARWPGSRTSPSCSSSCPCCSSASSGGSSSSSGQLRTLQRLGREPLQRHRDRRRGGAVLLHRRRGGGGHGQAGEEPPGQRQPGLASSAPP